MLRSMMRDADECEKTVDESEGENFDGGERKFEGSLLLHLGLSNPTRLARQLQGVSRWSRENSEMRQIQ